MDPIPFDDFLGSLQPVGAVPTLDPATRVSIQEAADGLSARLSLGDRACLALAKLTDATAITADRRWVTDGMDVDVGVIR